MPSVHSLFTATHSKTKGSGHKTIFRPEAQDSNGNVAHHHTLFLSELDFEGSPICSTFSIFRHFSLCRDLHFNRFDPGSIPQVLEKFTFWLKLA